LIWNDFCAWLRSVDVRATRMGPWLQTSDSSLISSSLFYAQERYFLLRLVIGLFTDLQLHFIRRTAPLFNVRLSSRDSRPMGSKASGPAIRRLLSCDNREYTTRIARQLYYIFIWKVGEYIQYAALIRACGVPSSFLAFDGLTNFARSLSLFIRP